MLQSRPRLAAGLHTALHAFAACMCLLWLAALFRLAVDEKLRDKAEPVNIRYRYGHLYEDEQDKMALFVSGGKTLLKVIELFAPPLLAALAIALSEQLPIGDPSFVKLKTQVGRVLGWQLPGRRFFMWWCGGMSVVDALLIGGFLAAIASHLESDLAPQYREWNAIFSTVDLPAFDQNMIKLEGWCKSLGFALYPCFACLFFPVAHDSFLNHMLGVPWQNAIKYHRWMGHITVWIITTHGAGWAANYAMQQSTGEGHSFGHEMFSWQDVYPHLAGLIAGIGAWALQLTSIQYIRRHWFDLFYRVHIFGFLVLLIFANMHYNRVWAWAFPGLMYWGIDLVFRFAQGASITTITHAHLSDDHSVATLELTLEEGIEVQPLHDYMLNVPCISRWEWHPFTCAGKSTGGKGGTKVTFNIKRYGTFTEHLFRLLEKRVQLAVRVQGPIGLRHKEYPWLRYNVLVCIVGGIGISPVLSMLRGLVDARSAAKGGNNEKLEGPQRVVMVWAARHKAEFTILDESVMAAAGDSDWLSVALHYTGSHLQHGSSMKHIPEAAGLDNITDDSSDTSSSGKGGSTGSLAVKGGCPFGLDTLCFPWASPLGFSLARPVQPKYGSVGLKIAAILLANLGGFCCVSLASVYYGEGNALGQFSKGEDKHFFSWIYGLLTIIAAFIGVLGLPVFAVHTWAGYRYLNVVAAARRGVAPETGMSTPGSALSPEAIPAELRKFGSFKLKDVQPTTRYASSLIGGRVGLPEAGLMLDIAPHRPDLRATLQEAAAEAIDIGGGGDVGVYVAGPQGMVQATKRLVADANDARAKGAPYLHFHQETWEL